MNWLRCNLVSGFLASVNFLQNNFSGASLINDPAHIQYLRDYRLHISPERYRIVEKWLQKYAEFMVQSREATLLTRSQFFRMLVHVARWHAAHPVSHTYTSEAVPKIQRAIWYRFSQLFYSYARNAFMSH